MPLVRPLLQDYIDEYEANIVLAFRPLDPMSTTSPVELHDDPSCNADSDGDGLDECRKGSTPTRGIADLLGRRRRLRVSP